MRDGEERPIRRHVAPGRIVAIDYGAKRTGVATCDPDRIVTRIIGMVRSVPLEAAIASLSEIIRREDAVLVIVGNPLTLRGEIGPQAQRVAQFVEELQRAVEVPIMLYDERLTSSEARRLLSERGPLTREQRRRGVVDELAARLLLDDYIQEQRFQRPDSSRDDVADPALSSPGSE
jgi:putative Holliday junction resolvase